MTLKPYNSLLKREWDKFVAESKNATFLFFRDFMDYHSDRFEDCSLMFEDKGRVVACLPANVDRARRQIVSHGGLTYGGVLMSEKITALQVLEIFCLSANYFREEYGAERWFYKPIPYIYSGYPAQEDLYALFRMGAVLESRGVSSAIKMQGRLSLTVGRMQCVHKAQKEGLCVCESDDVVSFWRLLNDVLMSNHGVSPVHTEEELELLISRFPERIRLFIVNDGLGELMAGCLVFDMGKTVHTQYMASSENGKRKGALDLLIHELVTDVFADCEYFDFGISTEDGGKYLNEGLIFQKEGFGGRAVCYDCYSVNLLEQ
jgi:hypothetical protein